MLDEHQRRAEWAAAVPVWEASSAEVDFLAPGATSEVVAAGGRYYYFSPVFEIVFAAPSRLSQVGALSFGCFSYPCHSRQE